MSSAYDRDWEDETEELHQPRSYDFTITAQQMRVMEAAGIDWVAMLMAGLQRSGR